MMNFAAIILAAGLGTRMKSSTPKMLHLVAGRPLIHYTVRAALDAGAKHVVVVVGYGGDEVAAYLAAAFDSRVSTARQEEQRGTGHATLVALPALSQDLHSALVLYGDTPLLEVSDLRTLVAVLDGHPEVSLAMLTCVVADPTGYGRVLRDERGRVVSIREHRDLRTEEERSITEINPGVYAVDAEFLRRSLVELRPNNSQKELYLTDIVAMAGQKGGAIAVSTGAATLAGVNDRAQLAAAEASMQRRIADRWAQAGVTIHGDPRIDDSVEIQRDACIGPGVVLRGKTVIGEGATIDVGSVIADSTIGPRVLVQPYSVITSSRVGAGAKIGPFAHLRPDSDIGPDAHIGNFVETKKTVVRARAKANHLAYLGDGDVGEDSNIGAGTIFCNYDGYQKHKTVLGKKVFIGSDSQIVAPVHIGDGAYVGTGTTVTFDVPAEALAIGRARQENKPGYGSKLRERLAAKAAEAKARKKTDAGSK